MTLRKLQQLQAEVTETEQLLEEKNDTLGIFKRVFRRLIRRPIMEQAYLDLGKKILEAEDVKGDRTGTGTKSIFGHQIRFDLSQGISIIDNQARTFWSDQKRVTLVS